MLNGTHTVSCAVTNNAMDNLEGVCNTRPDQREEQFLRLRNRIEDVADQKFTQGEVQLGFPSILLRQKDFVILKFRTAHQAI